METRFAIARWILPMLAGLAVLFACPTSGSAVEVYLGSEKVGSATVKLAVPDFQVISWDNQDLNAGGDFTGVLRNDLGFSSYFSMVDKQEFVQQVDQTDREKGSVNFDEWKTLEADAIIKGTIMFRPDETVSVECRVFDVGGQREIKGFRLTSNKENLRKIAHRTSNRIIEQLTGQKGIALTRIAFLSKFLDNKEIFVMDYDGFDSHRITLENSIALCPKWSPSANLILFTTYKFRNPDIYVISADGKNRTPLSTKLGLNSSGVWSPDGESVAFSLSIRGNMEIVKTDKWGKNMKQLTFDRAIDTNPAWSPDGKRIAFTSGRSGTPQIYLMDSEGQDLKRLTFSGNYNDLAAWSPKGDTIAYSSLRGGTFNIVVMDVNTLSETQLTVSSGNNENPSWSPDGRHIVFSSTRGGATQIYTMNQDGSNQKRLTNLPGMGYSPDWSSFSE